jgi:GGDEF domain-containing protein
MLRVLRKSLGPNEQSAFVDSIQLLIQEIVSQSIVADPAAFEEFKAKLGQLRKDFEDSPDHPKEIAKAVAKTLKQYNEGALAAFRSHNSDLENIVSALTNAMTTLGTNGEEAARRLQSVQTQLEKAVSLDDLRAVQARFAEHLERAREETLRQQTALSDMVSGVIGEFRHIQGRTKQSSDVIDKSLIYSPDALTGLPGRGYAEAILTEAHDRFTPSYATLFVVERLEVVTNRFGFNVADELLLSFSQHLAQCLTNSHNLYRWGPASFLSFVVSSGSQDEIRQEVQKVASTRIYKTIELGTRTALLPISCQYAFKPVARDVEPHKLIGELDTFMASVMH